MNFVNYSVFICLTILFIGCNNSKEISKQNNKTEENPISVDYIVVDDGVLYGAGQEGLDSGYKIARNEEEFLAILEKMQLKDVKISSHSDLVFEESMYVFLFDKVRNTGAYKFEVINILKSENEIIIETKSKAPDDNAPSVITQPYLIIKMKKNNSSINYKTIE